MVDLLDDILDYIKGALCIALVTIGAGVTIGIAIGALCATAYMTFQFIVP